MDNTVKKSLAMGLLVASASSYADYSTEFGLIHLKLDSDNSKFTSTSIGLNHYFEPIKTDKLHRYIASDYTKASSLGAAVMPIEIDIKNRNDIEADGTGFLVSGQYAIGNAPIALTLDYLTISSEFKYKSARNEDVDVTNIELGAKYYAENHLIILGSIEQGKTDTKAGAAESNDKETTLNLGVSKLLNVSSTPLSLSFGLSQIKDKPEDAENTTNTNLGLSATLIPSKNIAFNAELGTNSGDDKSTEGRTLGFGVAFFPTDVVTVDLSTSKFSAKGDSEDDEKTLTLAISAQF